VEFVDEHRSITRKQAELLLGVGQTAAGVALQRLAEGGELFRKGGSRNLRYFGGKPL
jgi:hypothetical protein